MMKRLLVPMQESDSLASVLRATGLLAGRFDSRVEALMLRSETGAVLASDDTGATTPALVERFERDDAERRDRLRAAFDAFVAGGGLPSGAAVWQELHAIEADVGSRGRLFDLIVVGRPIRGKAAPSMATLEDALFDTGRAVLIAPPVPPQRMGDIIVIAWNGSSETARTIAFAMPLLERAATVVVLTVPGGMTPGPTGAEACAYLEANGVAAVAVEREAGRRDVGEAILEEAARLGADLLIKGGYTRSRLRQTIFGGPTNHILYSAELPVFMAH